MIRITKLIIIVIMLFGLGSCNFEKRDKQKRKKETEEIILLVLEVQYAVHRISRYHPKHS